uniref:Uncharacterized protein n=1 Tax=Oryza meridionalis TaxID=40149 RepID=A0A0E0EB41_9ORYZ
METLIKPSSTRSRGFARTYGNGRGPCLPACLPRAECGRERSGWLAGRRPGAEQAGAMPTRVPHGPGAATSGCQWRTCRCTPAEGANAHGRAHAIRRERRPKPPEPSIHSIVLPRPTAAQSLPLWHIWSAQITLAGTAYLTVRDRHDGLCCRSYPWVALAAAGRSLSGQGIIR